MVDENTGSEAVEDQQLVKGFPEPIDFQEWTLIEIEDWLNRLQFDDDIVRRFTENNITGDVIPSLTEEHLKEMNIALKDRIRLKIEINKLVQAQGIVGTNQEIENLTNVLTNMNDLIQSNVEERVKMIFEEIYKIKEELFQKNSKPLPTPEKKSIASLSPFNLSSPTRSSSSSYFKHTSTSNATSPKDHTSKRKSSSELKAQRNSVHQPPLYSSQSYQGGPSSTSTNSATLTGEAFPTSTTTATATTTATGLSSIVTPPAAVNPVSEPLKQLRASSDDPCSKILQAAMKRHKLNDDWRNYALVICYGDQERILDLNEKPVMIFKELKEKGEHPAIMLRQKAEFTGSVSQTPGGKL